MHVYLNGQILPLEDAHISPLDRGFLFGDGVYEFIPVYDNEVFLLKEHLDRLDRSLKKIDMKNPLTHSQYADIIKELGKKAENPNHGIYLQITRGAGDTRRHQYSSELKPTIFAMSMNLRLLSAEEKANGLSAITVVDERWQNCDIKSLNLLPNILAVQQGVLQNAFETIFIKDGYLTEGTSSNIFVIKNNVILTPPLSSHILWGITRGLVLQMAHKHQLPLEERAISEDELAHADEIWVTSSSREVVPITRLNGKAIGNGQVGQLWKKVDQYFQLEKE